MRASTIYRIRGSAIAKRLRDTLCQLKSCHIDRPTPLCCLWPQNLEPTTASPPTARTVAVFIQAPAQDPPLPALCWLYSCVLYIPPSGAVATVVSSAPIINVPTQLNSTQLKCYTTERKIVGFSTSSHFLHYCNEHRPTANMYVSILVFRALMFHKVV